MDRHFPKILKKFKRFGIDSLSPSEFCLTLLCPSFSEYFYEQTSQCWAEVQNLYVPVLERHLGHPDILHRYESGKVFLKCLDALTDSSQSIPSYSLPNSSILNKISENLKSKNVSLMKVLVQNDLNCDGYMNKSELIDALEKLGLSPYDIIECIKVAGFRPGIEYVSIAGFCDLVGRCSNEQRVKDFQLFTKVLNAFSNYNGGLDHVFRVLDKNRDGRLSFEEFRSGVKALELGIDHKDSKKIFSILDRDNSKSISLNELNKKFQELGGKPKRLVPAPRSSKFDSPGEFVIKFLNGTLPASSFLCLEFQKRLYKTESSSLYGEILRIPGNKRSNCTLKVDYEGIIGSVDLSSSVSKETNLKVKLDHFDLTITSKYEVIKNEDLKEHRAAIKIQSFWRKYSLKLFNPKAPKKLITRKALSAYNKRFLLAVFKAEQGVYCQLHPAFTDQIPQDTVLSYALFRDQEIEPLLSNIVINPNLSLSTSLSKERIKGNLWVELIKLNNVSDISVKFGQDLKEFFKTGDKHEFKNIKISKPVDLEFTANGVNGLVFWAHAISVPFRWTIPAIVSLPAKANLHFRFKWVVGERLGEIEKAAIFIQQQWKEKKSRKMVRKRVK